MATKKGLGRGLGALLDANSVIETTTETETPTTNNISNDIDPFMTSTEIQNKPNKKITDTECRLFYEEALDLAYMHTNRLNIDDLTKFNIFETEKDYNSAVWFADNMYLWQYDEKNSGNAGKYAENSAGG